MNLLKKWLANRIWPAIATRFFRLKEIENFIRSTDERYLDATMWAKIRGVSITEAQRQLEEGQELHYLEECLLYEWPDSPVQFLVPNSYLGKTVRLSEVGYIGEDDQQEVVISLNRVRTVFIASEGGT